MAVTRIHAEIINVEKYFTVRSDNTPTAGTGLK